MNEERLYEKLNDYKRACTRLENAINITIEDDIVYDGTIQRFEFTFELSWKLMKAFLEYTGISELRSPRATIKEAFSYGLIDDGEKWLEMMVDRNKMPHLYDEGEAKLIYEKIKNKYHYLLSQLAKKIETELNQI